MGDLRRQALLGACTACILLAFATSAVSAAGSVTVSPQVELNSDIDVESMVQDDAKVALTPDDAADTHAEAAAPKAAVYDAAKSTHAEAAAPKAAVYDAAKSKSADGAGATKSVTYDASKVTPGSGTQAEKGLPASGPSTGMSAEMRAEVVDIIQKALDSRSPADVSAPGMPVIHASPEEIQAATMPDGSKSKTADAIRKAPIGQIIYEMPTADETKSAASAADVVAAPAVETTSSAHSSKHAWWAGKAVKRISKSGIDKKEAGKMPVGNITSIFDLTDLNDDQLYSIFTKGEPDIPGATGNTSGTFTFCVGNAILNAFTNESWPLGPWPSGKKSPLNNGVGRVWRGKVMYKDPKTNVTNLWNLLWSNSTVAAVANVTVVDPGLSADGKPSAVINYGKGENIFFRTLRDEIRRVGSSIWLGRAWVTDPVKNWTPTHPKPLQGAFFDAIGTPLNNTLKAATQAIGLQGPNSSPATSGGYYPEPGQPVAILYFALDCTDNAVPKLYYTTISETQALLSSIRGYNVPFYKLPALNGEAGPGAVENWELESPRLTNINETTPFILYPWKFSDLGPIGYIKLPAKFFEPVFGAWWLYDYQKNADQFQTASPKTKHLQETIEFPIREAAQEVSGPALNHATVGLANIADTLPSPFAAQQALHLPVKAP